VRRKQAVRPCLSTPAAPAPHPRPQPLTQPPPALRFHPLPAPLPLAQGTSASVTWGRATARGPGPGLEPGGGVAAAIVSLSFRSARHPDADSTARPGRLARPGPSRPARRADACPARRADGGTRAALRCLEDCSAERTTRTNSPGLTGPAGLTSGQAVGPVPRAGCLRARDDSDRPAGLD
jgi:hypothetical protein